MILTCGPVISLVKPLITPDEVPAVLISAIVLTSRLNGLLGLLEPSLAVCDAKTWTGYLEGKDTNQFQEKERSLQTYTRYD